MELITLEAARAAGLTHYFTGNPCRHGHVALRRVSGRHCTVCASDRARAWEAANPAKTMQRQRTQKRLEYLRNPDKIRLRNRQWAKRNIDKILTRNKRQRAQRLAAFSDFTAADWRALVAQSPCCHWCKRRFTSKLRPTHDHVIPLAKGGTNTLENSCCACPECNSRKRDFLINPTTGQGILI